MKSKLTREQKAMAMWAIKKVAQQNMLKQKQLDNPKEGDNKENKKE